MNVTLPTPAEMRRFKKACEFRDPRKPTMRPGFDGVSALDRLALAMAYDLEDASNRNQCFFPSAPLYLLGSNRNETYTANTANAVETSLFTGGNNQPVFPSTWFDSDAVGRGFTFEAEGILSTTTGPPTLTTFIRIGSTAASVGGTQIGATAAATTTASQTNVFWRLKFCGVVSISGQGSTNTQLITSGTLWSGKGLASPFEVAIEATTPDTATWTVSALDSTVQQYLQLSSTWSSASNSQTLKSWRLFGWR